MKNNYVSTKFLGYKIASTPIDRLLKTIVDQVYSGDKLVSIFTPNPEQLVFAKSHSWFDKTLGKSDILLPDGIGIVIGSQILSFFDKGAAITHRVTGVDVVARLLPALADKNILVIGGREYGGLQYNNWKVVQAAVKTTPKSKTAKVKKTQANKVTNRLTNELKSQTEKNLYWNEGFLNVTQPTSQEKEQLIKTIQTLKPDVIFVAFGAPHQEEWVIENKKVLEAAGVRLVMVVGGAFDMLLGKVQRAPKWMQRVGLEWLFRLYQEPWRWRRQTSLLHFMKLVVQEVLR